MDRQLLDALNASGEGETNLQLLPESYGAAIGFEGGAGIEEREKLVNRGGEDPQADQREQSEEDFRGGREIGAEHDAENDAIPNEREDEESDEGPEGRGTRLEFRRCADFTNH